MKTWSLGRERVVLELKAFFRSRQAAVFTFFFPVMLLVLFASIFHGEIDDSHVDFRQYFIAGIIASGIMSTSFNNLAISMAIERYTGVLKRLAGTPMPKASYFIGKIGMSLVSGVIQTALMLALGVALYGVTLPSRPRSMALVRLHHGDGQRHVRARSASCTASCRRTPTMPLLTSPRRICSCSSSRACSS